MARALEKKSEDRYKSAAEFAHALQAVLGGMTEVPPFDDGAPRPMLPSAGAIRRSCSRPSRCRLRGAIPEPARSSPLPGQVAPAKPPMACSSGIAPAFLVVGAILAAIVLKLVMK